MTLKHLAVCFAIAIQASLANASMVQINDRSSLGANDYSDWYGFGSAFTLVPSGSTINSHMGNTLTISNTTEPQTPFRVFQQVPPVNTGWWNGNFAPGDAVLAPNGRPGSMLIEFSTAIFGAGAQIGGGRLGDPFEAFVTVTDSTGLKSIFSTSGFSNSNADNSAIFLGVLSDVANIISLEYSLTGPGQDYNQIGLNRLDIASAEIPEPSTINLLLLALIAYTTGKTRQKSVQSAEKIEDRTLFQFRH